MGSAEAVEARSTLRADCGSCFALCCVALPFARSTDFAITKAGGDPCVNLAGDDRCSIHAALRPSGFKGCTVFDCFGAGQKVSQQTFGGVSWRVDPGSRASMFAVFAVVRQLHEVLWFLDEARAMLDGADPSQTELQASLAAATARVEAITASAAAEILAADVDAVRGDVRPLLLAASETARARFARRRTGRAPRRVGPGADLLGSNLRGADLRGVDLRGAYLIGADLRAADLRGADVLGADLRDADVRAADLSAALFLTQMQVNAAVGDPATRLPAALDRPAHWS